MKIGCNEELIQQLSRVYMMIHRHVDRAMTANGASLSRTKFLIYIERCEGAAHAAAIADLFDLAPRTVTQALDGLERDGLIIRLADPNDRRIKRLDITDDGRNAIAATEPLRHRLQDEICRDLSEEEGRNMIDSLKKMALRLD